MPQKEKNDKKGIVGSVFLAIGYSWFRFSRNMVPFFSQYGSVFLAIWFRFSRNSSEENQYYKAFQHPYNLIQLINNLNQWKFHT